MTCREKLMIDHPEWDEFVLKNRLLCDCPTEYDYHNKMKCSEYGHDCDICWCSEVEERPERTNMNKPKEEPKLIYAHTSIDTVSEKPIIKDSGNRREFESGAVRDMQEGKGRCDLMPLEVMAEYLYATSCIKKNILEAISEFKKTGCTQPLYSAIGYFVIVAYNEDDFTMCLEVAKHFEEGAKKYGENNWQKGIPPKCYIDSAVRHYLKWLRGDKDEPHDRAFVWNLMCCIWEVDYHKVTVDKEKECT